MEIMAPLHIVAVLIESKLEVVLQFQFRMNKAGRSITATLKTKITLNNLLSLKKKKKLIQRHADSGRPMSRGLDA